MEIDLIAYLLGAWVLGFTGSYQILIFKKLTEGSTT